MDELRGPNIQIVLHLKEGLGFGFLKCPFNVSGSLNGYMLETDPVVPCHAPIFDAELVWEADKRRFRSLRVQNVPVKVEVYTLGTQGRKDKVGYLLLSLLGAQPCPSNKIVDVKHTWHRLLGVRAEGKCCHPQLQISLTVEDRINTPTPRNELRMFHSNEVAHPTTRTGRNPPPAKSMLLTLNEYLAESKKVPSALELQPKLLCEDGLIQIGDGKDLFLLSLVIGSVENLDLLLPQNDKMAPGTDYYVSYSVFSNDIMTDRVLSVSQAAGLTAQFNQRTSLRLRANLHSLSAYFAACPHLVTRVGAGNQDIGICSMDLRKLIPTEDLRQFTDSFCNADNSLTIHERCFLLRCDEKATGDGRRPFIDVEMSLKYCGFQDSVQKPSNLTARSVTHLDINRTQALLERDGIECKSESCTQLAGNAGTGYTSYGICNTNRYKNASGDSILQTNELTDLIKRMCDSLSQGQTRLRVFTSDAQVQCGARNSCGDCGDIPGDVDNVFGDAVKDVNGVSEPVKLETSKSDTCIPGSNERDMLKSVLSACDRNELMQKSVNELEDWKEKQQKMFQLQLKRKEEYHLDLLATEWHRKRMDLERKLSAGVSQCRTLAADLSRAADDFRLRGYRHRERQAQLQEAKKALEAHYTDKYQLLREASRKMEDDMNHQLKLKDMRVEELEVKVQQLEKQVEVLKNNMKNTEKEAENKYSGLTKDQTASLIQELRCLEEKLDAATQSKAFFKEQWGRSVRELHAVKADARRRVLLTLRRQRDRLDHGLDTIEDQDEVSLPAQVDINKLKDDFYVDLLANTPTLEANSFIGNSGPEGLDMYDDMRGLPKNPMIEKLNDLIAQRDKLIQEESPDEELVKQLNHEIRTMLLNCGT